MATGGGGGRQQSVNHDAARLAAMAFLSQNAPAITSAMIIGDPGTGGAAPVVTFTGATGTPVMINAPLLSAATPTTTTTNNYYSQPSATPQQYLKPRLDHEAVAMQVAAEAEHAEKRAAQQQAVKQSRFAEAEALARLPTDTYSLSQRLVRANEQGLSEAAARRLAAEMAVAEQQQQQPVGAHYHLYYEGYAYQAPPPQQQQSDEHTALVSSDVPTLSVVMRREDLVSAMDMCAQQVWQNNVVALVEAFLLLVLSVVLVVKVNHML